jgi:hypothetical protein
LKFHPASWSLRFFSRNFNYNKILVSASLHLAFIIIFALVGVLKKHIAIAGVIT